MKDLTGRRYGELTVIERNGSKSGRAAWLCECDCGNRLTVRSDKLLQDRKTSCGHENQPPTCSIDGCSEQHSARGYCQAHYNKWYNHGDPLYEREERKCSIEDCEEKHVGKGYCGSHLYRFREYGDPLYEKPERICEVEGCEESHRASGLCNAHYLRSRDYTRPNATMYQIYRGMVDRCTNPNNERYHRYGGRGIQVHERYLGEGGFQNFLEDMGERPPDPGHWDSPRAYWTLDRINPDGDYEPGNLRWADPILQARNRTMMYG